MSVALRFLSICGSLALCGAQLIACNVTKDGDRTAYTIRSRPHVSAENCNYSWSNGSRHVLAHNLEENPELVMRNSIQALITFKCLDTVYYEQTCVPEGKRYSAICRINCQEKVVPQKDKEVSHSWIAAAVVVIALVALGFLCYMFEVWKTCRYLLTKAVKTADTKAADVEARNEKQDAHAITLLPRHFDAHTDDCRLHM